MTRPADPARTINLDDAPVDGRAIVRRRAEDALLRYAEGLTYGPIPMHEWLYTQGLLDGYEIRTRQFKKAVGDHA